MVVRDPYEIVDPGARSRVLDDPDEQTLCPGPDDCITGKQEMIRA